MVKEYLGLDNGKLNKGEKVISLLNNWDTPLDEDENYFLVNGVIGYVQDYKIVNEKENIGTMTFKPDFLDEEVKSLVFDNNVFETGNFKYEFHQQVYLMDDYSYEVKLPYVGRQNGESEAEYRERMRKYLLQKKNALFSEQINFFQDAYCISVHKSQGSEFDNVVVFNESWIFPEPEKWLYTAITRAKKNLVIIL